MKLRIARMISSTFRRYRIRSIHSERGGALCFKGWRGLRDWSGQRHHTSDVAGRRDLAQACRDKRPLRLL